MAVLGVAGEGVGDINELAAVNFENKDVAGEVTAVADQSISQLDESQVLVQPADVFYSDVGQEDGDGNEVIDKETSENLSMIVQFSDKICEANLTRSNSGSAVEEED